MTAISDSDDKFHDECGVFGVIANESASAMTALGLHALQHRGQEAAGIVTEDGEQFRAHHAMGLVAENFGSEAVIKRLSGNAAIGHVRYATTGETALRNVQPLFADLDFGGFALAHNGNLTNAYTLHKDLVKRGCIFHSTTDTEVVIHLMAMERQGNVTDRFIAALRQVRGAYSLIGMGQGLLLGVRDPNGIRPLVIGKIGETWVLASETCALDIIGAAFVRDVEPGELVILDGHTLKSLRPFPPAPKRLCVFEHIYFARPDSKLDGLSVYEIRKNIGIELAKESPVDADVVVPVPDSGVAAAIGYARQSKIPFELGIIRNHYVGRTFIQPTDRIRHLGVKLKHSANRPYIEGKRVVLIDDSIVRGTTSVKIVEMVRNAGAREVHVRISSPPTKHSCFYGIDTPEKEKLLAHEHTIEQMAKYINADSLAFISLDGLYRAFGEANRNPNNLQYCDACFSGDYPVELTDFNSKCNQGILSFLTRVNE